MNEGHNGNDVLVHPIDDPLVPHNEFSIGTGLIFRNVPTGFGEVVQLLDPLLDVQSKRLGIAGGVRVDERHQRLEVVARDGRPD